MAVEKSLVLAAIETKLKGKSLSKNFKDNLATKWAEKIETDDDITGYIDDREDVLLEASSEADRRAVAAAKKAKEESVKPDPKKEEEKVDDADMSEREKALIKKQQALEARLDAFESQQKSQTISERFKADDRIKSLKGVQDHMFKGRVPQTEEEYETAVEDFVQDWKPFLEKNIIQDQKDVPPTSGAGGSGTKTKQISADDAKAAVAAMGSF